MGSSGLFGGSFVSSGFLGGLLGSGSLGSSLGSSNLLTINSNKKSLMIRY